MCRNLQTDQPHIPVVPLGDETAGPFRSDTGLAFFCSTCGEDDRAAEMPAEDSERSGFPAWMASGSVVCPCPLGIGWEMLAGSRDPNMLFHSSFTFESCFMCFLAISNHGGEKKTIVTSRHHSLRLSLSYFQTRRESSAYMPISCLCS